MVLSRIVYKRILDITPVLRSKSVFLFGPRQTGKSTLLKTLFPSARSFNLLEANVFRELSTRPESLRESLTPKDRIVVVDEVQRIPELLDEIHLLIEERKDLRFVLTGSSARTLKRKGVNLLGGRARTLHLHPLVSAELLNIGIERRINFGSLPSVYDSSDPRGDLKDYVGTYLQEEIRAESMIRNLPSFSRFLEVAGLSNGQLINYASVGSDAQVPARTVKDYFQILEETWIGSFLNPFRKTKSRKAIATPKFYFFDVGVANILSRRGDVKSGSTEFGICLEHLIHQELRAYLSYKNIDDELSFWRPERQESEVDFLIGDHTAIEVKASGRIDARDLKGLRLLMEEKKLKRKIIVCSERIERKVDGGIEIIPYQVFFKALWQGEIV